MFEITSKIKDTSETSGLVYNKELMLKILMITTNSFPGWCVVYQTKSHR